MRELSRASFQKFSLQRTNQCLFNKVTHLHFQPHQLLLVSRLHRLADSWHHPLLQTQQLPARFALSLVEVAFLHWSIPVPAEQFCRIGTTGASGPSWGSRLGERKIALWASVGQRTKMKLIGYSYLLQVRNSYIFTGEARQLIVGEHTDRHKYYITFKLSIRPSHTYDISNKSLNLNPHQM